MNYKQLKKNIPALLDKTTVFKSAGMRPAGKIVIGFGLVDEIEKEIIKLTTGKNVLLITDQNLVNLKIDRILTKSLHKAGYNLEIFSEIEPEPKIETARKIQTKVRESNYDLVIGLGGGSVMDMAKTASLMYTNSKDIELYMTGTSLENEGLPCILIPTTSGTGSEVSPYIVLSKQEKKLFIGHPYVYATIALIDPLLTVTMPPEVTASTGIDALTHGVEGAISARNPLTEALSNKCVDFVFKYLERAYNDGTDLEARYYMSFASVMGMMSYSHGGGLYAHSMSYILTLHNNLPHGIGCGIALPYTLMFNYDYIKPIILNFASNVLSGEFGNLNSDRKILLKTVQEFQKLLQKVNITTNLKDLNIDKEMISVFAEKLVNKYYRNKNPRSLNEEEAEKLVKLMWQGSLDFV